MTTASMQALEQLHEATWLLGQRYIAYHPKLARLTGRVTAGLMLSQALYWTRRLAVSDPDRHGWFWKTRDDWLSETGLSRREQDSARASLKRLNLLQERRLGMPARVWYRIDLECLGRHLEPRLFDTWDWRNERALLQTLGRPFLFYRSLSEVTGAATAALLMSNLLAQERALLRTGEALAGWRRYQFEHLLPQTGLTRHELDHARRRLRQIALLVERRVGLPPRVEWQVRLEHLGALLTAVNRRAGPTSTELRQPPSPAVDADPSELSGNGPTGWPGIDPLDRRIPAIQADVNAPTDFMVSAQPLSANRTDWRTTNGPTGWAEFAASVGRFPDHPYVLETTLLKPPPTRAQAPANQATGNATMVSGDRGWGFEGLVWPNILRPDERPAASRLLATVPEHAQVLLDELAGQSGACQRIEQPLNYLAVLTRKAQAGEFIATAAPREHARRAMQAAPAISPTTPEVDPAERHRQIREGLANLRGFMAERMGQRRRG